MNSGSGYLALIREKRIAGYTRALAAWALFLGLLAIASSLYITLHSPIRFPFEDQWTIIEELAGNHGHYTIPLLWALHNEHRTPFAKLLETADLYWFHGRNTSLYVEIYLLQIIHLVVWVQTLRRVARWPGWLVAVGSGLAAFALFWISQRQSFNPLGVGILPATAFAFFSVLCLALAIQHRKLAPYWLVGSAASAFVAEGTLASGILLWPLLVVFAWRFRLRYVLLFLLAATGGIAIYFYMAGFHGPPGSDPAFKAFEKPALFSQYLLVYFSNQWDGVNAITGQAIAALAILITPVLYARELLRRTPEVFRVSLVTLCVLAVGTGLLTALGRLHFGVDQAKASRYQTSVLLFWLCLALYGLDVAWRHRRRSAVLAAAVMLLLTTAMLPSLYPDLESSEEEAARVNAGSLPIFAGVKDDYEIMNNLFVDSDHVFQERTFLRGIPTAFYTDPRYRRMGRSLQGTFAIAPPARCFGAFDGARRVQDPNYPGWQLSGWAWDHASLNPVEGVIAVTDGRTITGTGMAGIPRPDVGKIHREVSDPGVGWRLYLRGAEEFPAVRVYGIVDGGKSICLVTPPFVVPKVKIP